MPYRLLPCTGSTLLDIFTSASANDQAPRGGRELTPWYISWLLGFRDEGRTG
jgi:hypothetical protein